MADTGFCGSFRGLNRGNTCSPHPRLSRMTYRMASQRPGPRLPLLFYTSRACLSFGGPWFVSRAFALCLGARRGAVAAPGRAVCRGCANLLVVLVCQVVLFSRSAPSRALVKRQVHVRGGCAADASVISFACLYVALRASRNPRLSYCCSDNASRASLSWRPQPRPGSSREQLRVVQRWPPPGRCARCRDSRPHAALSADPELQESHSTCGG